MWLSLGKTLEVLFANLVGSGRVMASISEASGNMDHRVSGLRVSKCSRKSCLNFSKLNTDKRFTSNMISFPLMYYKLRYIFLFSNNTKKNIKELFKKFCKNSNINITFFLLKLAIFFWIKGVYQVVWNLLLYTRLFVQDVNPVRSVNLNPFTYED